MKNSDDEDIIKQIAQQAAMLLASGIRPRSVRVGKVQESSLRRLGHTGNTLTVPAPGAPAPVIAHAGRTNAASRHDEVSLLLERSAEPDELVVS